MKQKFRRKIESRAAFVYGFRCQNGDDEVVTDQFSRAPSDTGRHRPCLLTVPGFQVQGFSLARLTGSA